MKEKRPYSFEVLFTVKLMDLLTHTILLGQQVSVQVIHHALRGTRLPD